MKKRKHPHGYYKRHCGLKIVRIPGLSNNNLRMHNLGTLRSRTVRKWVFKYWDNELKAKLDKWYKGGFTHVN